MYDQDTIDALKRELDGYVRMGDTDRAAQVRAVLKAAGEPEQAVAPQVETADAVTPKPRKRAAKKAAPKPE
jgi:hypothetical protein